MEPVIKASHVSKKFEPASNKQSFRKPAFHSEHTSDGWVLRDISFEVQAGEVLGICGKNGAGKSTLLNIMSGIMKPTSGSIMMRGRIGSMLELGAGFSAELPGRENIMMTGALLGIGKKQVLQRIDDIIEFSGLGAHIDMAVKHYSSGMYMRLAFAALTLLDTDVLLFDEVMSVGDAEFRIKSSETIQKLVKSKRTIIMTSHNMQELQALCSRVIWVAEGRVKFDGHPHDVAQEYMLDTIEHLDAVKPEMAAGSTVSKVETDPTAEIEPAPEEKVETRYSSHHKWNNPDEAPGNEHLRLIEITIKAQGKNPEEKIFMNDPIEVNVTFKKTSSCNTLELLLVLFSATGEHILIDSPAMRYEIFDYTMPEDTYFVTCIIPAPLLNKGVYFISLAALCNAEVNVWQHERLAGFKVHVRDLIPSHPRMAVLRNNEDSVYTAVRPHLKWQMTNKAGKVIF